MAYIRPSAALHPGSGFDSAYRTP